MDLLKIAWRNIWRNKKRTLITAGSVFFALTLSILMVGLQSGTYDNMIKTAVEDFYGYIQVHKKGYSEDPVLINSMDYTPEIQEHLISNKNVKEIHPRIETFTLCAFEDKTKGVPVIGVVPELEFKKPGFKKRLIAGEFPTSENGGLLITEKFAEYMAIELGDSLAFMGQGYQGVSAVGLYPVVGILKLPNPQLNAGLVYMSLNDAQELFSMQNMATSVVLRLEDNSIYKETAEQLSANLPEGYEVLHWEQEMPELVQMIESDAKGGQMVLMILYIVVGFGIFGTALMMIAERIKEFGIMISLGMQKTKVVFLVGVEMIFISIVGIVGSIVTSVPIIYYLYVYPIKLTGEMAEAYESMGFDPIMPAAWDISYYITQPFVVIVITILAMLYPLYGVRKLNVIKALRK